MAAQSASHTAVLADGTDNSRTVVLADGTDDSHTAMLADGTDDSHHQTMLAFLHIVRYIKNVKKGQCCLIGSPAPTQFYSTITEQLTSNALSVIFSADRLMMQYSAPADCKALTR